MTFVMIAMSTLCFVGTFVYGKQDRESEILAKINAEHSYNCIFGDDKIQNPNDIRNIEMQNFGINWTKMIKLKK